MQTAFEIALEEAGYFAPSAEDVAIENEALWLNGGEDLESCIAHGLALLGCPEWLDGSKESNIADDLFATSTRNYN